MSIEIVELRYNVKRDGRLGRLRKSSRELSDLETTCFRTLNGEVYVDGGHYRLLRNDVYTTEKENVRRLVKYERVN